MILRESANLLDAESRRRKIPLVKSETREMVKELILGR
jgi:hypothetical protein